MSTNVTLTGTLGQDPELRFTSAGKAVASLSVVTSKSVKTDSGAWENHEETWWRVTAWEKLAENVVESLKKGDPVIVVGRSFMESYVGKDGAERQSLKVNAFNVGLDLKRRTVSVNRIVKDSGSPSMEDDPWATPVQEDAPPF
jgi:single-strand DNA-binding protein